MKKNTIIGIYVLAALVAGCIFYGRESKITLDAEGMWNPNTEEAYEMHYRYTVHAGMFSKADHAKITVAEFEDGKWIDHAGGDFSFDDNNEIVIDLVKEADQYRIDIAEQNDVTATITHEIKGFEGDSDSLKMLGSNRIYRNTEYQVYAEYEGISNGWALTVEVK